MAYQDLEHDLHDYPPCPDRGFWRGMMITLCVVLALYSLILLFFLVFP